MPLSHCLLFCSSSVSWLEEMARIKQMRLWVAFAGMWVIIPAQRFRNQKGWQGTSSYLRNGTFSICNVTALVGTYVSSCVYFSLFRITHHLLCLERSGDTLDQSSDTGIDKASHPPVTEHVFLCVKGNIWQNPIEGSSNPNRAHVGTLVRVPAGSTFTMQPPSKKTQGESDKPICLLFVLLPEIS